jgi:hypothetical protein
MRRNSKAWKEQEARRAEEAAKPRMTTNYSHPKRCFFAGMNDLRHAMKDGDRNVRLEKRWNEECEYPITDKYSKNDFRDFKGYMGVIRSIDDIKADTHMDEFEKYLSLNYRQCFGTEEAVKAYYEHGRLTEDNIRSGGRSHLVKITDIIKFYEERAKMWSTAGRLDEQKADLERVRNYKEFYITGETSAENHWVDLFTLKDDVQRWIPRKFKRKLWVVVTYHNYPKKFRVPLLAKVLNVLAAPLKFIPERSVLRMPEYTNYTFRIGSVVHGYEVEFQIPKKFSFKN